MAPVMAEVPKEKLVASTAFASAGGHYFCPFTAKNKEGCVNEKSIQNARSKSICSVALDKIEENLVQQGIRSKFI